MLNNHCGPLAEILWNLNNPYRTIADPLWNLSNHCGQSAIPIEVPQEFEMVLQWVCNGY